MVSQLHVSLKRPGLIPIRRPVVGELEFVPTLRWVSESHEFILPMSFTERLVNGELTVSLEANAPWWVWKVIEHVPGGLTRYLNIPETNGGILEYTDLVDIDISTLDPIENPEAMWWAIANNGFLPVFSIDPNNPEALLVYMQTWQRDPVTGALLVQVRVDND